MPQAGGAPSRPPLPRSVKALGLVSLLTDVSSEMIYPLLPAFLTGPLKASPAFLGLVEGIAEAAASLFKILSGHVSDGMTRRKPLVVLGYGLSSAIRPLVALAAAPWHVLAIRFADRVGKGTRSAPRDALIGEVTPADQRGRAYGFHRAMDHAGAFLGPLLASAVLWVRPGELRLVFALAAIPAVLSVIALVAGVREHDRTTAPPRGGGDGGRLGRDFRLYLALLALFTLGNSSDAFLLLRAQETGIGLALIPILWAFHHLVKSVASTAGGGLSDRIGRRSAILAGWGVYAATYAGFAVAWHPLHIWCLFGFYGLFHALTEGPERALVADLAAAEARGRAFGIYHAVTGVMLLPASLLTGVLWQSVSPAAALLTGAGLAGAAAVGLLVLVREPRRPSSSSCRPWPRRWSCRGGSRTPPGP